MEMLLVIQLAFLWDLSLGISDDAVIQYSRTGVVKDSGAMKEAVWVNGVSVGLLHDGVYNITTTAISIDSLITVENNSSFPNNLNYIPLRECRLKGQRVVLWSNQNGKYILALYPANDTWTAHEPQRGTLGQIWNHDTARSIVKGLQLEEECAKLLEKLHYLENSDGMYMITVVVLLLAAVVFTGLIFLSFVMSKKHAQVGGVLGSIIHYPTHSLGMSFEGHTKHIPCNIPSVSRVPY
ncbi:uncharacterized protein LOC113590189 isoform X2 [Electrophorus electricus]|uniref:uncharacterized protein LOC113590189 isoform X2 n=1 Tax=Electrophorus electricus TaxID=8005 RepID=UPI000F09AC55|nr:uncharacterized protein LOC113590189 isoform X2 [Electrophorus electricus]